MIKSIIVLTVLVVVIVFVAAAIAVKSTKEQKTAMKEWLKYAVVLAEKELGSGTGQLKLRFVYELFVGKFAWLPKWISFAAFSVYVDEALDWLKEQLSSNEAVATLVNGEINTESETTAVAEDAAEGTESEA